MTALPSDPAIAGACKMVCVCLPELEAEGIPLSQRTVLPCKANQIIARVVEMPEGAPPPALSVALASLRLGRGVAWAESARALVAVAAGHIRVASGEIAVDEQLEIREDVDPSGGEISFPGPVAIHRDVHDLVRISAGGTLTVGGSIEAAFVETAGDLIVRHGICGKERGRVTVGGNVEARFVSNADLRAAGSVTIGNEAANSRIVCGEFTSDGVSIMGGHVTANLGIACHTAGSPTGVRTILELGPDPALLANAARALAEVDACRQRAEDIRQAVGPLMKNQKNLTAAQKEKATELLFRADEIEQETRRLLPSIADQQTGLQAATGACVRVIHMLHAGVIVRYPHIEARVPADVRGPVSIAIRTVDGQQRIVATGDHGGRPMALPTTAVPGADAAVLSRLMSFSAA